MSEKEQKQMSLLDQATVKLAELWALEGKIKKHYKKSELEAFKKRCIDSLKNFIFETEITISSYPSISDFEEKKDIEDKDQLFFDF